MRSALFLALVIATPGLAQTGRSKADRGYQPQPVQHLVFTGEDIDGSRRAPSIEQIYAVPRPGRFESLIRVRTNFSDKLLESVHEL
jgi:hypothetical protein